MNGQAQTFGEAQAAGVDELERGAIAAQADVGEQLHDLIAGQHRRQGVVILGADLAEDLPVLVPSWSTKNIRAAARA